MSILMPPDSLAKSIQVQNVPSGIQYGCDLAKSALFRSPDMKLKTELQWIPGEYLVYYYTTRNTKEPSHYNAIFMTNQRFFQTTEGNIRSECWLGDIESVSIEENGFTRWDQIKVQKHSDKKVVGFGIYANKIAKFFYSILLSMEGAKGSISSSVSNQRFQNKVVLVTGSTHGIGFAITKRMVSEGAKAVITSRKDKSIREALQYFRDQGYGDDRVFGCRCHIGRSAEVKTLIQKVVEHFGHIDVLVCNAAISPPLPTLLRTPPKAWNKIIETNLNSPYLTATTALQYMATGGSIIMISSVGGYNPSTPHPAYGVSKTALFGLTKALANEAWQSNSVRVNCVAPGMIKTRFSKPIWQNDKIHKMISGQTILKRLGEPEEIASCVAFLASDDAAYITGEVLVASGGLLASRL